MPGTLSRAPTPRAAAAVAAFAVVLVAAGSAGCAAVPTSGPVQVGAGQGGFSQEQAYSQPIPEGPGSGWTPVQIVSGFLAASASFAHDHAVAREYLDSTAQQNWQPGWAVTVESSLTTEAVTAPKQLAGQPGQLAKVRATGLPVATLTDTGQYLVSASTQPFNYSLVKVNGQWRIDALPRSQLLLTENDFQRVYQPRDLYYLTQSGDALVPDPVFVPQQATDTELATGLVQALLQDPGQWLADAASTAFPAHSWRIGQVRINGPNATVDLGGKAVTASRKQLWQMAAQLVWTLAHGSTNIQSVQLELNGRPVQLTSGQYQLLPDYSSWVQGQSSGSSLYFLDNNGAVEALTGAGQQGPGRVGSVQGAAGSANAPALSSVAISPDRRLIAGIAQNGGSYYIGGMSHDATLRRLSTPGGTITSVSWDAQGDLWIAAGGEVWMLPPGATTTVPVAVNVSPGATVTDLRIAPDGVRVAMIIGSADGKSGAQVQVGAITRGNSSASTGEALKLGSSIADPRALAWYGEDNLLVLAGNPGQLYEVPLNGGQPIPITVPGGYPVSVSATGPETGTPDIAIGLANGTIMVSANQSGFEATKAVGSVPVYPG
jgi:Lipoprotein LpqB beta-propeller domain/Sporulation and spore germination